MKIFGFTAAEAGLALLEHRNMRKPVAQRQMASHPLQQGDTDSDFDSESYEYWLRMVDEHNLSHPGDTAALIRQESGNFQLFVYKTVDTKVYRLQWTPEIKRKNRPKVLTIHDSVGGMHKAVVLRG